MPAELARVAVAAAIAVIGYLLARASRYLAVRLFRRGTEQLLALSRSGRAGAGLPGARESSLQAETAALDAAGRIVFWLVFALFLGAATSVLGFPVLSAWLESLAGYLPRVLAAAAIVLLGVLSGLLLRAALGSARITYARSLARGAQLAVVGLSVAVAIEELGIEVTFLIVVAAVVLGATLGGAALAFGLGARTSVSNLLACHYLAKWYRVGHVVRIGEHEGRIVEILPSAVVLATESGRVYVPAREFADRASVLISDGEGS